MRTLPLAILSTDAFRYRVGGAPERHDEEGHRHVPVSGFATRVPAGRGRRGAGAAAVQRPHRARSTRAGDDGADPKRLIVLFSPNGTIPENYVRSRRHHDVHARVDHDAGDAAQEQPARARRYRHEGGGRVGGRRPRGGHGLHADREEVAGGEPIRGRHGRTRQRLAGQHFPRSAGRQDGGRQHPSLHRAGGQAVRRQHLVADVL